MLELCGQSVQAVPIATEESLDATWAEPEVFGGCSSQGQTRPNTPQPIHIVRKPQGVAA